MNERQDEFKTHRPARILLRPRHPNPEQKRAFERTTTRREVPVVVAGEAEGDVLPLVDVSPTGVKLAADEEVAVGTQIQIEVLPGEQFEATVRWCRREADHWVFGAEFLNRLAYDQVWKIRSHGATE